MSEHDLCDEALVDLRRRLNIERTLNDEAKPMIARIRVATARNVEAVEAQRWLSRYQKARQR